MAGDKYRKALLGYGNRLSVRPGERIEFKISSDQGTEYDAQLVRLVNGDVHSSKACFREVEIDSSVNGTYCGRQQPITTGSCVVIGMESLEDDSDQITIALNVMPTTPLLGEQHLIGRWNSSIRKGWSLHLNKEGCLSFSIDARGISTSAFLDGSLKKKSWYHVALTIDWVGQIATLVCMPCGGYHSMSTKRVDFSGTASCDKDGKEAAPLLIAAAYGGNDALNGIVPVGCFNGRIEAPVMYGAILRDCDMREVFLGNRPEHLASSLIADWDFSIGVNGPIIFDRSSNGAHGRTHNLPLRAVRGTRWNGRTMEWPSAPEQYSAIHFHSDDLYDCGWQTDIDFLIPDSMRSGIYALRVRTATAEEYIPFLVAAPMHSPQSAIAILVPTYTYVAYGNIHALEINRKIKGKSQTEFYDRHMMGPGSKEYALTIEQHYDLGGSTYDRHRDGSPIHFASWLRPLLNVRPKSVLWTLCADLLLTDWLEAKSFDYDVISDDLLQQEGVALLSDYRTVITGNHPEYCTTKQIEAVELYVANGGRLMYLGGNGFYWRVGVAECFPAAIEVRRGQTGTSVSRSGVGEVCLSFTGEMGGIWRDLGRPPQQLVGVGFIAEGAGSSYYRVLAGVRESSAAFILKGVDGDVLGDFGIFGGAAGQEIDRANSEYGTADNAIIVARSENHSEMLYVIEEMLGTYPVQEYYRNLVCSEIVYFENEKGGAVFSVGSMAWSGSLGYNNYDNNISTVTENVLARFTGRCAQ